MGRGHLVAGATVGRCRYVSWPLSCWPPPYSDCLEFSGPGGHRVGAAGLAGWSLLPGLVKSQQAGVGTIHGLPHTLLLPAPL